MTQLYQKINNQKQALKNFNPEIFEIPSYITENIKYQMYDWQKEAFENFLYYQHPKSNLKQTPTHLLFNMATGSGKTLVMAALILWYYKQGYRHFIFFVNQNNIVDKTENNFLDPNHAKYLYQDKIVIDDKRIEIDKVETFSDNPQNIEIKFTTVQQLYNDIHVERENKTTLDDLHKKDIVMLGDEAHHLNATTKRKDDYSDKSEFLVEEMDGRTSKKDIERKGWEHTIIELILKKNGFAGKNNNALLEFTATVPENDAVVEKYKDKKIYNFGLKEFLSAGYTKEINLIPSTFSMKQRILHTLLFNWYRHKIALKYNIANFKPVILFRSKTIKESQESFEQFKDRVSRVDKNDFDFLSLLSDEILSSDDMYQQGNKRTLQVLRFMKENNIAFSEVAQYVKVHFQPKNIIITNSKLSTKRTEKTTQEQENKLNNLEDPNNHIRAIFTVKRLTEGWDVLNLFDIVRLYQGTNYGSGSKKTPQATTEEKQLIGRGVRYYPFTYQDKVRNKRKFDDEVNHELRMLEELFYHTFDEQSRYIYHLKRELRKDGYIQDDKVVKKFKLKDEFTQTDFYKNVKIWKNKKVENPNRKKQSFDEIPKDVFGEYKLPGLELKETGAGLNDENDKENDRENVVIEKKKTHRETIRIFDIEKHIFMKALNIKAAKSNSIYQFHNLQKNLKIQTVDELQNAKFLGDFIIHIILEKGKTFQGLENKIKLDIILHFLEKFEDEFEKTINPLQGSEFVSKKISDVFGGEKEKVIDHDDDSARLAKSLREKEWYVLDEFSGSSEERNLIRFIEDSIGDLEKRYENVYLLRNEEVYKIYDFKKGRGFQPDFLLLLKGQNENMYYQVFIEPKGDQFVGNDGETFGDGKEGWKQDFLKEISQRYGNNKVLEVENKEYKLIGLPFFNEKHNTEFTREFGMNVVN